MRIAIITTAFLKDYIEQVLSESELDLSYYLYTNCQMVGDLYRSIEDQFDGFLISGAIPKEAILKSVPHPQKPIMDFGTETESYYKAFMNVMYKYDTFDFDNGYVDLLDWAENPKPLSEYLATSTLHKLLDNVNEHLLSLSLDEISQIEKRILDNHLKYWRSGKILFSTTRLSSIIPTLQREGVNFHFIYPSAEIIKKTLLSLIREVEIQSSHKNQPAVILVAPSMPNDSVSLYRLYNALMDYNKRFTYGFDIQSHSNWIRIFTTKTVFDEITHHKTSCALMSYLEKRLDFEVYIGFGIGKNINSAIINGKKALQECNNNINHHSFVVDEDGRLIGPLIHTKSITVPNQITKDITALSDKTGLSTLTIQKISSVVKDRQSLEISPIELSEHLGVTVRTANRFLSALYKNQLATIAYQRQNSSKGRPERVYALDSILIGS